VPTDGWFGSIVGALLFKKQLLFLAFPMIIRTFAEGMSEKG